MPMFAILKHGQTSAQNIRQCWLRKDGVATSRKRQTASGVLCSFFFWFVSCRYAPPRSSGNEKISRLFRWYGTICCLWQWRKRFAPASQSSLEPEPESKTQTPHTAASGGQAIRGKILPNIGEKSFHVPLSGMLLFRRLVVGIKMSESRAETH